MRYLIMHNAMINGAVYECLFQVVCGSRGFAEEQLKEAIAATGDTTMWLHAETEEEYREAWY